MEGSFPQQTLQEAQWTQKLNSSVTWIALSGYFISNYCVGICISQSFDDGLEACQLVVVQGW